MEPWEADQCPSWERRCEGAPAPPRPWGWVDGRRQRLTRLWGGAVWQKGVFPPQQKAPWETALSHLLSFFLSLGLSGLKKFSVSKIKSKMRETGAWGGAKNSA